MSDEGQMPLFVLGDTESTPGAAVSAAEAPEGVRMPRTPGWAILAPSDGLWHATMTRHYDGTVTATCGRSGRYVPDTEHEIMACPICSVESPPI